jgi:hypothetical protein
MRIRNKFASNWRFVDNSGRGFELPRPENFWQAHQTYLAANLRRYDPLAANPKVFARINIRHLMAANERKQQIHWSLI